MSQRVQAIQETEKILEEQIFFLFFGGGGGGGGGMNEGEDFEEHIINTNEF
jgi:hypothetical protein